MGKAADPVSVEGLSSSTAGVHLKNLLMSVRLVQVGQILAPLPTPPLTVSLVFSPWKADTISAIYCKNSLTPLWKFCPVVRFMTPVLVLQIILQCNFYAEKTFEII